MVKTASKMIPLGTVAPSFELLNTVTGQKHSLSQLAGKNGTCIAFICNHCPFVKHLQVQMAAFADQCIEAGIAFIAISANDVANYPDDSPEKMKEEAIAFKYNFPYLYDETQAVAKAYEAACTPDFYLFDANLCLVYRGQFDDSRPGDGKAITGESLQEACDCLLEGKTIPGDKQKPSIGCNIKWIS